MTLLSRVGAMSEGSEREIQQGDVVRRLDAIISLLAQDERRTVRQSILALSNAGLRPVEIARILGKEQATIRGELSRARTKRKLQTGENREL